MANVSRNQPKWSLDRTGTATCIIGNGSDSRVATLAVHIVDTGSLSASIVVKQRSSVPAASDDSVPFVVALYRKMYLNGAAGDGSLVETAITTTSIIEIPCSGLEIALDVTYTSGTGTVYVLPMAGPSVI